MKNNGAWSKEVFARNLKYYMEKFNKNQKEMANIVGVSPPAFCEWLNAKKYPRIDKIEILANYFGILKSDLIEDKQKKNSTDELPLTDGEKMLLELFRKIPEEHQPQALEMLRVALKMQKKL